MDDQKRIWKEHLEKLMNAENEWTDSINAGKVEHAMRKILVEGSQCAMN